jgi:hypothetical protein
MWYIVGCGGLKIGLMFSQREMATWYGLREPFGASPARVGNAKPQKNMVGTRRLELLTSTVSTYKTAGTA